jgi:biotin synthase-related radical SAM superfamily protein
MAGVHIDQQRALIEQRVTVEETAGTAYLAAVNLDIVARPEFRIDAGIAFRTSGCPGKFADDISACDRPYGDSPPSNIASYPFQPNGNDLRTIRKQLGTAKTVT